MKTIMFVTGLALMSSAALAAGPHGFDAAMQPVLVEYLKIHNALASDKQAGVAQSAARIEKLAARLKPTGTARAQLAGISKSLVAAAAKLRQAKGLPKTREVFKELSQPMVSWATIAKPANLHVVTCSMAKASWLQREKEIANPYYGSQMLRCGEMATASH